jgi:hypothetical protein
MAPTRSCLSAGDVSGPTAFIVACDHARDTLIRQQDARIVTSSSRQQDTGIEQVTGVQRRLDRAHRRDFGR